MENNFQRYFTLDEAQEALPQIVAKLEAIQNCRSQLQNLAATMETMDSAGEDGKSPKEMLHNLLSETTQLTNELVAAGILVRSLETGLIDFPSRRDGEDVFLCYMLGESDIKYWHAIHEGYTGRQSI